VHLAAITMLVLAGGTFTHFESISHSHDLKAVSEKADLADHDHYGSSSDLPSQKLASVHCGANILFRNMHIGLSVPLSSQIHWPGKTITFAGLVPEHDPPPPRLFS